MILALNIYVPGELAEFCITNIEHGGSCRKSDTCSNQNASSNPNQAMRPSLYLLYCEFSSERAPRMFRFIRNFDRKLNMTNYPRLFWPNIFIILGGYKRFYNLAPTLCSPVGGYVKMEERKYSEELRKIRKEMKKIWKDVS